ncbi:MAG: hypothetical protein AAFN00_22200, partial [Cyanobacteria bacterium J06558_2]
GSSSRAIINRANSSIPNSFDPTGQDQIKQGLAVSPGQTLALLGNGVTFDGGAATAPAGNIELGSVANNNFVALEPIAKGWRANYGNVNQFQDLVFDGLAAVDVSGDGGGDINVQGKNIRILNGSAITSNTLGDLDGGTISVQASNLLEINGSDVTGAKIDLLLAAETEIFLPFSSQISSNTFGAGDGGNINITTDNLKLIDGGSIELQTFPDSTGQGGNLFIVADGFVELKGIRSLLGLGENVPELILPTIDLDTAIDINQASEISTASIGRGDGGNINLKAKKIRLEDGASIAANPFSEGNGGSLNIEASQSIEIFGISPRTGSSSSSITANTFSNGNAGNLNIITNRLSVKDGGFLISTTASSGNAGNISIDASSVEISGFRSSDQVPSSISAQTVNGGKGGNISINTGDLKISDRASLSVQGTGNGVSGNINVIAEFVELENGGNIVSSTEFQSGGNINLDIAENLTLRDNSLISSQAFQDANGGNLDIAVNFLIAFPQGNNDILASAVFGDGGNITISGEGIFGIEERLSRPPNLTNDIDATSEFGQSGTVTLGFPDFADLNAIFRLPQNFANIREYFDGRFCNVSKDSSFTIVGGSGIPDPLEDKTTIIEQNWSDWRIAEDTALAEAPEELTEVEATPEEKQLALIQGWFIDAHGNVVLTDQPVARAGYNPGLTDPDCNQMQSSVFNER